MRFPRGSTVEVLYKKKEPSGVWRCAEIVENNRDGYTVKYYSYPGIAKVGVDKVPADAVRPCPPRVTGSMIWAVDDIVEVLDGCYWKVSVIEEVMGDDCYQVRVINSIREFRVQSSSIRSRQEWKDHKWVPIAKDSGDCEDLISRMRRRTQLRQQGTFKLQQVPESALMSKSLKRSFADGSFSGDVDLECMHKRRAVSEGAEFSAVHGDSYSFIGKDMLRHGPGEEQTFVTQLLKAELRL